MESGVFRDPNYLAEGVSETSSLHVAAVDATNRGSNSRPRSGGVRRIATEHADTRAKLRTA